MPPPLVAVCSPAKAAENLCMQLACWCAAARGVLMRTETQADMWRQAHPAKWWLICCHTLQESGRPVPCSAEQAQQSGQV